MSNWTKHLVNLNQTPEERRAKYALCKQMGENRSFATQHRDWRWNKIARYHGYQDFNHMRRLLGL